MYTGINEMQKACHNLPNKHNVLLSDVFFENYNVKTSLTYMALYFVEVIQRQAQLEK